MRGITEEQLIDFISKNRTYDVAVDALYRLWDECQELNPWQPIETAPKDKLVLIRRDNGRLFLAI